MSVYPGCRVLHVLLFEVYTKISKKTLNNFYVYRSFFYGIAFYLFSKGTVKVPWFFYGCFIDFLCFVGFVLSFFDRTLLRLS